MSEDAAQQEEPSIEEILGSIRRIISEDDEPEEVAAEAEAETPAEEAPAEEVAEEPAPVEEPAPTPAPVEDAPAEEEDVLELTQMIEDDGNVTGNEDEKADVKIDMLEDEIKPDPVVEDLPPLAADENLVSDGAADVTAAVMAKLARSAAVTRRPEGIAIEDIVRELVKPMLRQWLDDNLPDIVEQMVERELERIARRAKN